MNRLTEKDLSIRMEAALAAYQAGNIAKAQQVLDAVFQSQSDPDHAEVYHLQGLVSFQQNQNERAIAAIRKAIELKPDAAKYANNLALIYKAMGDLDTALDWCNRAISMKPDFAEAYNNKGIILDDLGRKQEAIACYEKAIEIVPNYAKALCNMGFALNFLGHTNEALNCFRQAIASEPDMAEAYNNMGITLYSQGKNPEAIVCFQRALMIRPNYPDCYSNLLFSIQYGHEYPLQWIYSQHRGYDRAVGQQDHSMVQEYPNPVQPDRRLKIGYVSPDFRKHSCAYFLEPLIRDHDRESVEVYCYAEVLRPDSVTRGLQNLADHWRSTVGMSQDQLAEQIRTDGIDILVDLAGHTARNRLPVFALKPAPIQVTWLGYDGTTGMDAMDYRISDPWLTSDDTAEQFSESLYRLPRCSHAYCPSPDAPPVAPPPVLKNGYITFGSFNNLTKIHPTTVALWARVLKAYSNSILILKSRQVRDKATTQRLTDLFAGHGIHEDQLMFLPYKQNSRDHLATYHMIDIGLDTYPYNGVTTTCEALWMGVPVVSLRGNRSVSRTGYSILCAAGLDFLVATDPDQYLAIIDHLVQDPLQLEQLRLNMRARLRSSPLLDTAGFTQTMESAFRDMWQTWCRQHPPRALDQIQDQEPGNDLVALLYSETTSPADRYNAHRNWAANIRNSYPGSGANEFPNDRTEARRLRVGYVSPHFRNHPMIHFIEPLLCAHDRSQVEIYGYAQIDQPDATTDRIKGFMDHWIPTSHMDDVELARQIRQDQIDILIDLAGHLPGNRLPVFAQKPAPITLSWMGYDHTTGLDTMDYRITDGWMTPENTKERFTETLYRLSRCCRVYQPPKDAPPVRPAPVLTQGTFSFGAFANPMKISRHCVAMWTKILDVISGSRLKIRIPQDAPSNITDQIVEQFRDSGFSPSRIEFIHLPTEDLTGYEQVDIVLDTYPYNGVVATCQALWMGVPVVTRQGELLMSRSGLSLLSGTGLDWLVAENDSQYVDIVRQLATDPHQLNELRMGLREKLLKAPLTNARELAQEMESAYRNLWVTWCRQSTDANSTRVTVSLENPDAAFQQALEFHRSGRLNTAGQIYQQILDTFPDHADALHMQGLLHFQHGKKDQALELIHKAVTLNPSNAYCQYNLAILLNDLGDTDGAIRHYEKAIQLKPDYEQAHYNLGGALREQGRVKASIACYERALAIRPDYVKAHGNLLFSLMYITVPSPQWLYQQHCRFHEIHGAPLADQIQPHSNNPDPDRPLRIGYVSPDFRSHSCIRFIEPLLAHHDRQQVEIFCYAEVQRPDHATERIRRLADHWYSTVGKPDAVVVDQIRKDQIDILIDLAGHTAKSRLLVFAYKPAPVQVTWLGYNATTGLKTMDYRISDPWLTPPGSPEKFTEQVYNLPRCSHAFLPPQEAPEVTSPPCLQNGYITFGSFNNLVKIQEETVALWARAMNSISGSRLVLKDRKNRDQTTIDNLLAMFRKQGVESQRITILPYAETIAQHLAQYAMVDICLDTWPYNGVTTTCEALWMGVPVISLAGWRSVSRVGRSLLHAVDLPHLAVDSPDAFAQRAKELALDTEYLTEFRKTARDQLLNTTLLDAKGFAREMEAAFRAMWRQWCGSEDLSFQTSNPMATDGQSTETSTVKAMFDKALKNHESGQLDAAASMYRQILDMCPNHPDSLHYLGVIAFQTGKYETAEALIRKAINKLPENPVYYTNLAIVLHDLGRIDEARDCCERALALQPENVDANLQMGLIYHEQGHPATAEPFYRKVLDRIPNHPTAWCKLGNALREQFKAGEAIKCYQQAVAIHPANDEAYHNMGSAYHDLGQFDAALACYDKAIHIRPNVAGMYSNKANAFKDKCMMEAAISWYQKSLEIDPHYEGARSNLLLAFQYSNRFSHEFLLEQALLWDDYHGRPVSTAIRPHDNNPDPDRRLRIGYVSPDFHYHSCAWFLRSLFRNHDKDQVAIFCYSESRTSDQMTEEIRSLADSWYDTVGKSDDQVADQIRQDRIDILVDLAGHTSGNRLLVFARKPAPIQVTWLGYGATTGLRTIDYRISDPWLTPPDTREGFSETLWRLPRCCHAYSPPEDAPQVASPPVLKHGHITFGSFNNLTKAGPETIRQWVSVLDAVPGSRLLIKARQTRNESTKAMFLEQFAEYGISSDRIGFMAYAPDRETHLAAYHQVDICLDTFPYNGVTTTCEAMWMGVPVVTITGDRTVSRFGMSLLAALGLESMAATSAEEFVRIAADLASQPQRLKDLRIELRSRMEKSPLCDGSDFARHMEQAFREMWKQWVQKFG